MMNALSPFVIPIFIPHAGCPHRCVFCDQNQTTGQYETLPTVEQLNETVDRFLSFRKDPERYTEISFYGGNFLGLPTENIDCLLGHTRQYIDGGLVQGIRFSTRPDTIDGQRLELLSRFPITTVELGVQSLNDEVLKISRRGHTAVDTLNAVRLLKTCTYRIGLQMMVGLPGDTVERAMTTGDQIAALAPDFVRIYPTVVLKGSPLARWHTRGRFAPLTVDEAVAQVKSLYALFSSKGIKVVRMGLQPTEDLNTDAGIEAGPFHPAFGELVHSALWLDAMINAIEKYNFGGGKLKIKFHPAMMSRVKGHKNKNMKTISDRYGLTDIHWAADSEMSMDEILINGKLVFSVSPIY